MFNIINVFESISIVLGLILFAQFFIVSIISYYRIKSGENGITYKLFAVSLALSFFMLVDLSFSVLLISGQMNFNLKTIVLASLVLLSKIILIFSNYYYYNYIKKSDVTLNKTMTKGRKFIWDKLKDL